MRKLLCTLLMVGALPASGFTETWLPLPWNKPGMIDVDSIRPPADGKGALKVWVPDAGRPGFMTFDCVKPIVQVTPPWDEGESKRIVVPSGSIAWALRSIACQLPDSPLTPEQISALQRTTSEAPTFSNNLPR
jgi:hypothetical protein